jgi:predicted acetyltransferase
MTRLTVRAPSSAEERNAFARHAARSFAMREEVSRTVVAEGDDDLYRVAASGAEIVGGYLRHDMGQFFGGRRVPMGGVALVAVAPEARGAGVARALMTTFLEEMRARGVPLSSLYPAAQGLYRSLGWEQAGSYIRYRLPLSAVRVRERALTLRDLDLDDDDTRDQLAQLYQARARLTPGHLDRSPRVWRRMTHPLGEEAMGYLVEGDSGPEGYVVYQLKRDGSFKYDFVVRDLVATTARALRRLLGLIADHRSLGRDLVWCGGPTDPILLATEDQAHSVDDHWRWMLRLIDVPRALEQRGWPVGLRGELHLEVVDDLLPDNRGPWIVDVHDGAAEVRPGGRGDVRLGIGALSALYSGDASPWTLMAAGRAQVADAHAPLLASLFAGPAPWTPDFF